LRHSESEVAEALRDRLLTAMKDVAQLPPPAAADEEPSMEVAA